MSYQYVALEEDNLSHLPQDEAPVWAYTEWEYRAEQEDELSFPSGIWLTILENKGHGWLKAQFNGKIGLIPENHIKYVEPANKFTSPVKSKPTPILHPRPTQTLPNQSNSEHLVSSDDILTSPKKIQESPLVAPPRPRLTLSKSVPTASQTLPQVGATPAPSADKLNELKKQIDQLDVEDFHLDIKYIDQTELTQQKPKNLSNTVKGHLKSISNSSVSMKPINRRHSEKVSPIVIDKSSPYKSSPTSPNYGSHYDKPTANNKDLNDEEDFYEYFNSKLETLNNGGKKSNIHGLDESEQGNLLDLVSSDLDSHHQDFSNGAHHSDPDNEDAITEMTNQHSINRNSNNPFLNDMMHSNSTTFQKADMNIFQISEEKHKSINQESPFEFPSFKPTQDPDLTFTPWQDFKQLDYFTSTQSQPQPLLDETDSPAELVRALPNSVGYENNFSDNHLMDEDSDIDDDEDNELNYRQRELVHRISSTSLDLVHQGGVMKLEGSLNVKADALDGGSLKEVKHWKSYTVMLCRGTILIYKLKMKSAPYKFKGWFDLHHAQVLMGGKQFSKKKNVFVVQTCTGIQALFQTSSETETLKWYNAIQQDIKDQGEGKIRDPAITNLINMNQNLKAIKPKPGKKTDKSKISQPISEPIPNATASGKVISTTSTQTDSVNIKSQKSTKRNIGNFLKGLDKNKDQSLGSAYCWGKLALNNGDARCHLVELLIDEINSRGIDSEGIYRLSGNSSSIKKWKEKVEKGQSLNLQEEGDINVLTGILKLFFRELSEPLIPFHLYGTIIQASLQQDYDTRLMAIKECIYQLPQVNFSTLKKLANHLWAISEHCEINKMDTSNLALVFAPTLMRNSEQDLPNVNAQHSVIDSIIVQKDWMFDEEYSTKSKS